MCVRFGSLCNHVNCAIDELEKNSPIALSLHALSRIVVLAGV